MRVGGRQRKSEQVHRAPFGDIVADTYITDGTNLFRCVSIDRSPDADPILALEDCRTLEVIVLPLTESVASHVRVVARPYGTGL